LKDIISKAYNENIRYFETSSLLDHGEKYMGKAIQELNLNRDDIIIATKLINNPISPNRVYNRKSIIQMITRSLQKMKFQWLDLIFIGHIDDKTDILEICRTMDWAINQGWCFYWGCTDWSSSQFMTALWYCDKHNLHSPLTAQTPYNILQRRSFEIDFEHIHSYHKKPIFTYSPLYGGILTGKYETVKFPTQSRLSLPESRAIWEGFEANSNYNEPEIDASALISELKEYAEKLDISLTCLSIAWTLANSMVGFCTVQVTSKEQLQELILALKFSQLRYDSNIEAEINGILNRFGIKQGKRVLRQQFLSESNAERDCGRVFQFNKVSNHFVNEDGN